MKFGGKVNFSRFLVEKSVFGDFWRKSPFYGDFWRFLAIAKKTVPTDDVYKNSICPSSYENFSDPTPEPKISSDPKGVGKPIKIITDNPEKLENPEFTSYILKEHTGLYHDDPFL